MTFSLDSGDSLFYNDTTQFNLISRCLLFHSYLFDEFFQVNFTLLIKNVSSFLITYTWLHFYSNVETYLITS